MMMMLHADLSMDQPTEFRGTAPCGFVGRSPFSLASCRAKWWGDENKSENTRTSRNHFMDNVADTDILIIYT